MSRLRIYTADGAMPVDFTELDDETVVEQTTRWFSTAKPDDLLTFEADARATILQRRHVAYMVATP